MPIKIKCPLCGSAVRVAEKYAGLKVKCPTCQSPIAVPSTVPEKAESLGAASKGSLARSAAPEGAVAGQGADWREPVRVRDAQQATEFRVG
jgi:endogenous inhibitor of DNA gyrase (YacG/DUF329 family)